MEHTFPVRVEWSAGRQVVAGVPGKPSLRVGAPPEFDPDADPAVWSPEDLFCSAVATCLAVTITGQARKRNVPLVVLTVTAAGTTGRRTDGRYGFTSLDLDVALTTEPGYESQAAVAIERAEAQCLVSASLDVPVRYSSAVSPGRGSATPDSGVPTTDGLAGRR